jgi:hypothetical protein
MCLIPHNLLDLQILLAILSLKKVSKKRNVSQGASGDGGEGAWEPKSDPCDGSGDYRPYLDNGGIVGLALRAFHNYFRIISMSLIISPNLSP